jgi:hydroxylamine reductase
MFGNPSPAEVKEGLQDGPGILVTGHDLLDLATLLKQVEGTDIKVYTHGEMLPAWMYPKLREHPNLAGHYGGAWQKQRDEFEAHRRRDLRHDHCVLIPRADNTYLNRFFTTRSHGRPRAVKSTTQLQSVIELPASRPLRATAQKPPLSASITAN